MLLDDLKDFVAFLYFIAFIDFIVLGACGRGSEAAPGAHPGHRPQVQRPVLPQEPPQTCLQGAERAHRQGGRQGNVPYR